MTRAEAAPERDADQFQIRKGLLQPFGHRPEFFRLDPAGNHIRIRGFDSENLIRILFVAHRDIAVPDHLRHHLSRLFPPLPEFGPVIQIAGNRQSHLLGLHDSLETDLAERFADRRRDPGPVEPVGIRENLLPVHHPFFMVAMAEPSRS